MKVKSVVAGICGLVFSLGLVRLMVWA